MKFRSCQQRSQTKCLKHALFREGIRVLNFFVQIQVNVCMAYLTILSILFFTIFERKAVNVPESLNSPARGGWVGSAEKKKVLKNRQVDSL